MRGQRPAFIDREAVYIYTLSDPRTGCIRYVGKTIDPDRRYKQHLSNIGQNSYRYCLQGARMTAGGYKWSKTNKEML